MKTDLRKQNAKLSTENTNNAYIPIYSFSELLDDTTPVPDDLISPRVLPARGLLLLGGLPKIGKSDFLLSLLLHMAAGVEFLALKPPRPLRIFYLQTHIDYHDLRRRLAKPVYFNEDLRAGLNNLAITPPSGLMLDAAGVQSVAQLIRAHFGKQGVDIIVIDSLRDVFDSNWSENDATAMQQFLQNRLDVLRNAVNSEAGIIVTHQTKHFEREQLEYDLFPVFSATSSLCRFYSTGIVMFQPDWQYSRRELFFDLRNGSYISSKMIDRADGIWKRFKGKHSV